MKDEELKRKIFIGGLAKTATESQLELYFSKFGKIDDILINRSSKTGGCKGCAFVLFKDESVAKSLIDDPSRHGIGGKMVEVKSCHRKGSKVANKSGSVTNKPPTVSLNSLSGPQGCNRAQLLKKGSLSTANSVNRSSGDFKNVLASPFTQATLTEAISPLCLLASPLPDISFTPLEDLEDDVLCLEVPQKKELKVQTM